MTCRVQCATRQRKPRSTRVLASQRHTIICQKICGNYVCEVAVPQCYQRPGNRDQLVNLYWAMSLIKMHYDIWELCPRTAEDVEAVGSVNVPVSHMRTGAVFVWTRLLCLRLFVVVSVYTSLLGLHDTIFYERKLEGFIISQNHFNKII